MSTRVFDFGSVAASLKRRQISDKFPVVKSLERFRGVIGAATVVRQQQPTDLLMLFSAKKIGRIIELSHGCWTHSGTKTNELCISGAQAVKHKSSLLKILSSCPTSSRAFIIDHITYWNKLLTLVAGTNRRPFWIKASILINSLHVVLKHYCKNLLLFFCLMIP